MVFGVEELGRLHTAPTGAQRDAEREGDGAGGPLESQERVWVKGWGRC